MGILITNGISVEQFVHATPKFPCQSVTLSSISDTRLSYWPHLVRSFASRYWKIHRGWQFELQNESKSKELIAQHLSRQ